MDKTHDDLSTTGEKSGPRAVIYHKLNFSIEGRGQRGIVDRWLEWTQLKLKEKACCPCASMIQVQRTEKFPSLQQFTRRTSTSDRTIDFPNYNALTHSMQFNGLMDNAILNDYVNTFILPLYPNISLHQQIASCDGATLKRGASNYHGTSKCDCSWAGNGRPLWSLQVGNLSSCRECCVRETDGKRYYSQQEWLPRMLKLLSNWICRPNKCS